MNTNKQTIEKERMTSQKQIILDYLYGVKIHPSAEKIFKEVRKKLPRISMGTVYRNLENFVANGEVLEIPGGVKRFDGDITPHGHFICQKCGKIIDIFGKIGEVNLKNKNIRDIGVVKEAQIYIYGICKKCAKAH